MKTSDFEKHWDDLANSDPDYVVDVLDITTEELLQEWGHRAVRWIEREFHVSEEDDGDDE